MLHIHKRINAAIKKKEIMVFTDKWMEMEKIMVSEISQTQKIEG